MDQTPLAFTIFIIVLLGFIAVATKYLIDFCKETKRYTREHPLPYKYENEDDE